MTPIIAAADVQKALGQPTYNALFDDANAGAGHENDQGQVDQVIKRAHAQLVSWLPDTFTGALDPLPSPFPDLLYSAELDYAVAFAYERHPEYVRQMGTTDGTNAFRRAERTMENVAASIQRMPDFAQTPKNVSGASYDTGSRILVDNADGTSNAGDF